MMGSLLLMNNDNECHLSLVGETVSKATWLHGNLKYFGGDLVLLSRSQIFGNIRRIFLGELLEMSSNQRILFDI